MQKSTQTLCTQSGGHGSTWVDPCFDLVWVAMRNFVAVAQNAMAVRVGPKIFTAYLAPVINIDIYICSRAVVDVGDDHLTCQLVR